MAAPSFLVVGLGNPGEKYAATRHNVGFWLVDKLCPPSEMKVDPKFCCERASMVIDGVAVDLIKPMSFMNRSGDSVVKLLSYYRLSVKQLLVVHDDLDLPPGGLKVKFGGGHGGHNGLRDIISKLGSKDFYRARVGIGHPGSRDDVVPYVLGKMQVGDKQLVDDVLYELEQNMSDLVAGNMSRAMTILNKAR